MSRKPSPSKLRLRTARKAVRELDPIVQEKARKWAESRRNKNDN